MHSQSESRALLRAMLSDIAEFSALNGFQHTSIKIQKIIDEEFATSEENPKFK